MRRVSATVILAAFVSGCASTGGGDESAHAAHDRYVEAINSDDLERVMAMLTDDVVFMPPGSPRLVGKDAVRAWAEPYVAAYEPNWEKTSLELIVSGDWAFEQYAYVENDRARDGGAPLQDEGKGIIIYHRGSDGEWRVARDAWNSNLP